jgi:hypothetical protein
MSKLEGKLRLNYVITFAVSGDASSPSCTNIPPTQYIEMISSSASSTSDTTCSTLATSVDKEDKRMKSLDFSGWELAKSHLVSNEQELIALSDSWYVK